MNGGKSFTWVGFFSFFLLLFLSLNMASGRLLVEKHTADGSNINSISDCSRNPSKPCYPPRRPPSCSVYERNCPPPN